MKKIIGLVLLILVMGCDLTGYGESNILENNTMDREILSEDEFEEIKPENPISEIHQGYLIKIFPVKNIGYQGNLYRIVVLNNKHKTVLNKKDIAYTIEEMMKKALSNMGLECSNIK